MQRQIDISGITEQEGLMYDLDRARAEGLMEEVVISRDEHEVKLPAEAAFALAEALDMSVNVPPGELQAVAVTVDYEYCYGKIDETVTA